MLLRTDDDDVSMSERCHVVSNGERHECTRDFLFLAQLIKFVYRPDPGMLQNRPRKTTNKQTRCVLHASTYTKEY